MRASRHLVAVSLGFAMALTVVALPAQAQELPLKRVMLSTGGVGYFEHEAQVTGNASLSLEVRLDQVDDVLKSIVVYDETGRVGTIGLPGREPLAQAFRDLPFGRRALASPSRLLQALKGAQVAVSGPRQIAGRVLSVTAETVTLPNDGGTMVQHRVTLYTAQGLEGFILEEAQAVRLADSELQAQVNGALAAIARHRVADKRTLDIKLAGQGRRKVRVAYVVPTPLWKSSYRLTLARDGKVKTGHLQGWAVIENMTGRDWAGVELALVSGNPVTFRQAIYQAYYVQRPEVPVEVLGRILPKADSGAVAGRLPPAEQKPSQPSRELRDAGRSLDRAERSRFAKRSAGAPSSVLGMMGQGKMAAANQAPPPAARPAFSTASKESATQVVFRIPRPVDLASGHSMIVPIADRTVPAERVSLYQPQTHARHPVASAGIANDAKSGLPGGVLTLYERDGKGGRVAYLGDAQLRTLPAGERRMVGFALDEKTGIEREVKSTSSMTKGSIARGVFKFTRTTRRTTLYRLKGAANEGRRVVIEHPRRSGWSLIAPAKTDGVVLAEGVYRIPVDLKPGEEKVLTVETSYPVRQSMGLASLRAKRAGAFAATDTLSAEVRAAFKRIAALMTAIDRHKGEVKSITQRQKDVFSDQRRIRDNMRRVNNRSQLYQRYMKKLAAQEDDLEALEGRLETARSALQKAETALKDYIGALRI